MTRKVKAPVPLYSALADATRCRIIEILTQGPVPVHKLAEAFPVSRPAISRHLRVLKTAGLVVEVKKGRENLYTLRIEKLTRAVEWIDALRGEGTQKPTGVAKAKAAKATSGPVADAASAAASHKVIETVALAAADGNSSNAEAPAAALSQQVAASVEPETKPGKSRSPRTKAPEPEIQQMGFEF